MPISDWSSDLCSSDRQDKLSVSRTNMRYGKKAPDVSDMLPTVRKRGVIQTLLVRPNCQDGHHEIVAGARRFHAARIVAKETGERKSVGAGTSEAGRVDVGGRRIIKKKNSVRNR